MCGLIQPVFLSDQLAWIEYNASTSATTGVSPFQASLGYQPPLLSVSEGELAIPSVRHHMRRCQRAWQDTRAALLRTSEQNKRLSNHRRIPTPTYRVGQQVWLYAKHIPLKTESKKLAPHFFSPFSIQAVLNPVTVQLALPRSMRVYNVIHVSPVEASQDQPFVTMFR